MGAVGTPNIGIAKTGRAAKAPGVTGAASAGVWSACGGTDCWGCSDVVSEGKYFVIRFKRMRHHFNGKGTSLMNYSLVHQADDLTYIETPAKKLRYIGRQWSRQRRFANRSARHNRQPRRRFMPYDAVPKISLGPHRPKMLALWIG
jgi:hypothetical protein